MVRWLKKRLRYAVVSAVREALQDVMDEYPLAWRLGAAAQIPQRQLCLHYMQGAEVGSVPALADTGYRVFSQFEEDGMLMFLFAVLGTERQCFVDIGAADGINSNCANLALNFGWTGVFVDASGPNVSRGRSFYSRFPSPYDDKPVFVQAKVTRENVNEIVRNAGFEGVVDLLSIDIDGNDYWIWDALDTVDPRVVVVEAHVEFGHRSIVVPYDPDYSYPGRNPMYHGASPIAMSKLAARKGYRLVGANKYGFNQIYVKQELGRDLVPEVSVESTLQHPRTVESTKRFGEISDYDYVEV